MTWGMFSVGWLDLNNDKKALDLFNRSFKPYVRQPFKVKMSSWKWKIPEPVWFLFEAVTVFCLTEHINAERENPLSTWTFSFFVCCQMVEAVLHFVSKFLSFVHRFGLRYQAVSGLWTFRQEWADSCRPSYQDTEASDSRWNHCSFNSRDWSQARASWPLKTWIIWELSSTTSSRPVTFSSRYAALEAYNSAWMHLESYQTWNQVSRFQAERDEVGAASWSHACIVVEDPPGWPPPHHPLPGMITWWMAGALGLYADEAYLFLFIAIFDSTHPFQLH